MSHSKSLRKVGPRVTPMSEGGVSSFLLHSGIGFLSALLFSLPLTLIGAVVCASSHDPLGRILPISLIILYLSSLFGGWITRRLHRTSALLCGLSSGILLMVFSLFLSLFFPDSQPFSFGIAFLLRALILFFSILGGYLGAPRPKQRKKRRR